jgi:sugar/nucleoside kinase (ribokinase family)
MTHTSGEAQIVVAGHICLDVIPELREAPDVRPGGTVEIGPSAVSTGGPVGNVGLALHRLGVPVRLVGKIGDDMFGREVLGVLRGRDPRLADGMIVVPGETTSYSIVVSPPGIDRTFLHCPGANNTFGGADVRPDRLGGARILHFGYPPLMRRLYEDGGSELCDLFAATRRRGLIVSLDVCEPDPHSDAGAVDWMAFLTRVLREVDVFAPSLEEMRDMLGLVVDEAVDLVGLRALADRLLALGPAVCALKLGEQGLYIRTSGEGAVLDHLCSRLGLEVTAWRQREVLAPCFQARRVAGTTGSGDCTIAGFLASLLRGEDPVTAATCASAVGACSVEAPDATTGVPPWTEVAARVAAGWPRLPAAEAFTESATWQCDAHGTLFDPPLAPHRRHHEVT